MSWNEENIPKYLDKAIQSSSPLIREELGHVLRIMQKTPTTANLVAKYCLQRVESAETIDERLNMAEIINHFFIRHKSFRLLVAAKLPLLTRVFVLNPPRKATKEDLAPLSRMYAGILSDWVDLYRHSLPVLLAARDDVVKRTGGEVGSRGTGRASGRGRPVKDMKAMSAWVASREKWVANAKAVQHEVNTRLHPPPAVMLALEVGRVRQASPPPDDPDDTLPGYLIDDIHYQYEVDSTAPAPRRTPGLEPDFTLAGRHPTWGEDIPAKDVEAMQARLGDIRRGLERVAAKAGGKVAGAREFVALDLPGARRLVGRLEDLMKEGLTGRSKR